MSVLGLARQLRLDLGLHAPEEEGAEHLMEAVDDQECLLLS